MRSLTTPKLMKIIPLHFFPVVSKITTQINISMNLSGCKDPMKSVVLDLLDFLISAIVVMTKLNLHTCTYSFHIVFFPGQLILSLDKDTYEQLGLEGQPSQYNHKKAMRFGKCLYSF